MRTSEILERRSRNLEARCSNSRLVDFSSSHIRRMQRVGRPAGAVARFRSASRTQLWSAQHRFASTGSRSSGVRSSRVAFSGIALTCQESSRSLSSLAPCSYSLALASTTTFRTRRRSCGSARRHRRAMPRSDGQRSAGPSSSRTQRGASGQARTYRVNGALYTFVA